MTSASSKNNNRLLLCLREIFYFYSLMWRWPKTFRLLKWKFASPQPHTYSRARELVFGFLAEKAPLEWSCCSSRALLHPRASTATAPASPVGIQVLGRLLGLVRPGSHFGRSFNAPHQLQQAPCSSLGWRHCWVSTFFRQLRLSSAPALQDF